MAKEKKQNPALQLIWNKNTKIFTAGFAAGVILLSYLDNRKEINEAIAKTPEAAAKIINSFGKGVEETGEAIQDLSP